MIHSKYFAPRVFPWNGIRPPEQINRAQDIGGDLTLNREKQYEIGREEVLGYKHNTPAFTYTMRQFEYGEMELWYALANKATPGSGESKYIVLDDIQATISDIAAYLTDDNSTFRGSIWFPKLRVNTCSINIGDPQAIVERNFNLVGEDYKIINENYFAYTTATVSGLNSGEDEFDIDFGGSGEPVLPLEYTTGSYIFRVLRIRAGVVSEVTTYIYTPGSGTGELAVTGCQNADVLKVFYASATAYTSLWADADTTPEFLLAECCVIEMKVGTSERIYKLQTVGIDVTFDRTDYREIGNSEIVQTGVRNKTVTINLDRYAEDFALEDILDADTGDVLINPRDFADNIQIRVSIYSDKNHTSFKMGYLITKAAPIAMATTQTVQEYNKRTNRLESDNLKVSTVLNELAFV